MSSHLLVSPEVITTAAKNKRGKRLRVDLQQTGDLTRREEKYTVLLLRSAVSSCMTLVKTVKPSLSQLPTL